MRTASAAGSLLLARSFSRMKSRSYLCRLPLMLTRLRTWLANRLILPSSVQGAMHDSCFRDQSKARLAQSKGGDSPKHQTRLYLYSECSQIKATPGNAISPRRYRVSPPDKTSPDFANSKHPVAVPAHPSWKLCGCLLPHQLPSSYPHIH